MHINRHGSDQRQSDRITPHSPARRTTRVALLGALLALGCETQAESGSAATPRQGSWQEADPGAVQARSEAETIAHGQQLVQLGGCQDCHTPMAFDPRLGMPVPQKHLAFSGHPHGEPGPTAKPGEGDQAVIGSSFTSFGTPFGVVYAANLTSDVETGIGGWTESEFIATLRTGRRKGTGRVVLPPMPWQNLASLTDSDLKAMFAYLMSLPPVSNQVPEPAVPEQAMRAIADSAARAQQAGG